MRRPPTRIVLAIALLGLATARLSGAIDDTPMSPALRAANPRSLSGGMYSALAANGAFGGVTLAARARAGGGTDLSKGKPPAVLDARVGVNVRLGDDPIALPATQRGQVEPHIARSAANPDLLLATFQEGRFADGGAVDCGYALSRDGGLSWTRALIPQLTLASGGTYRRATDPVAAIGPQGELYLSTLVSKDDAFGSADVVVSRSFDGGATWLAPRPVFSQTTPLAAPDKDWMVVNDFPGTSDFGRIIVTWTNFTSNAAGTPTGSNLLAIGSGDGGVSWFGPVAVTAAGSANQGSQPLFLPDGGLVVIYATFPNPNNASVFSIQCIRSNEGGRTFASGATTAVANVNGYEDPDLRNGLFLPSATVARQTGEIFVTYVAVVAGTPRVMVTKSSTSGANWSTPVVVSDNPPGRGADNPAVAVTPDGKTVSVVFIDKRNSPIGADGHAYFIDHYAAMSFDGGATWQPNVRLSEMSSDVRYAPLTDEGYMLGDYLGIAAPTAAQSLFGQNFIPIWCDTRTGDADPFIVRLAPSATGDYAAWCLAHNLISLNATDDADHDGITNLIEFADGTDPLKKDLGDALFVRRLSADSFDVMWAQRTVLNVASASAFISPVVVSAPVQAAQDIRFISSGQATVTTLTTDQLPAIGVHDGLAWTGVRLTNVSATAFGVDRRLHSSTSFLNAGEQAVPLSSDSRLINLSTRGPISQVDFPVVPMIAGFVTRGGPRSLLLRGVGPSLATFGLPNFAADPSLFFLKIGTATTATVTLAQNDNWLSGGIIANSAIAVATAHAGAFPLIDPRDSVVVTNALQPANYSVQLLSPASAGGTTGLVEIYDVSANSDGQLVNLSTLGRVGPPDQALIAGFVIGGFVIGGTQPRRVLLRAIGPSLAQFNTANLLADPVLTLYDRAGKIIAVNDDWEISRSSAAIAATAQNVGAFALNSASLDSALLITLAPGAYTAVVTGANGATGTVLVEVYDAN